MISEKSGKIGIVWWFLFVAWVCLSVFIAMRVSSLLSFSSKARSTVTWLKTEGRVTWDARASTARSTQGFQTQSTSYEVFCSYTYSVDNVNRRGRFFEWGVKHKVIGLEIYNNLDFNGKSNSEILNGLANEFGKAFGSKDGMVPVYYNPENPDEAVLVVGKSKDTLGDVIKLTLIILVIYALFAIHPIRIFLKKKA